MRNRSSSRLQTAANNEEDAEQEAWRRAQKEDAELYRRYLLAHASVLRHLSWLLHSHGSKEERAEYTVSNKLRAASRSPAERARLSEQMDSILQSLRVRAGIADAHGSGAAAKARELEGRLAVWRGRRDAARTALDGLRLTDAAFSLGARAIL